MSFLRFSIEHWPDGTNEKRKKKYDGKKRMKNYATYKVENCLIRLSSESSLNKT